MKQQTAVEWLIDQLRQLSHSLEAHLGTGDIRVTQGMIDDFEEKAKQMEKEQAERMYSEEDLKKAYFSAIEITGEGWNGEYAQGNSPNIEETFQEEFNQWFEQFKKK